MPSDLPPDELRMRAALGLQRDHPHRESGSHKVGQSPLRRRFAREGEVAVTMINSARPDASLVESPRIRMMALEEALATEQSCHARTTRALDDALAAIKALETKSAHAELTYADAIKNEQGARAQTEMALQQLQVQLHEMEERAQQLELTATSQSPKTKRMAGPAAQVGKRSKTRAGAAEPEPVKWWLPSDQAGKRRR